MSRDGLFEMARIRFQPQAMERVRREWFSGLVEENPERESVVVTLVACSYELLAGWVLSFGTSAEVLAPARLKELVATEAEMVAAKYTVARPRTLAEYPKDTDRLGIGERNLPAAKTRRSEPARIS